MHYSRQLRAAAMTLISATSVTLLACQPPAQPGSGQIALGLRWPQANRAGFGLKAIPSGATSIRVRITPRGEGVSPEVDERFERAKAEHQRPDGTVFRRWKLDVGPKRVSVEASDASGVVLAADARDVNVNAGVSQTLELELSPVNTPVTQASPTPSPSPSSQGGGNGGSSSGSGSGPGGLDPDGPEPGPDDSQPSPSPESTLPPQPESSPSPTHRGGSGGSNPNAPQDPSLTGLTADPTQLSGAGYTARLSAIVVDPDQRLVAANYTWTCMDANLNPCSAPVPDANDPNTAYWTAPGGFAVTNFGIQFLPTGPYTIKLVIQGEGFLPMEAQVMIDYDQGTSSVGSDSTQGGVI